MVLEFHTTWLVKTNQQNKRLPPNSICVDSRIKLYTGLWTWTHCFCMCCSFYPSFTQMRSKRHLFQSYQVCLYLLRKVQTLIPIHGAGGMAQAVERLPSKWKALSSFQYMGNIADSNIPVYHL
jgi:hypothetical protein